MTILTIVAKSIASLALVFLIQAVFQPLPPPHPHESVFRALFTGILLFSIYGVWA